MRVSRHGARFPGETESDGHCQPPRTLGAEPASPAAEIRRADQLLPWFSANCVAERDRGQGIAMFSARQFIGAATTALLLITGAFLLALAAGNAPGQGSAPPRDAAGRGRPLPPPLAAR